MAHMKHNVVIVGSGLFGSIAATLARATGHKVTVISNKQPQAASGASGCVLAPSWLTSLEREQVDVAMDVLKTLYTVHDLTFSTNLLKKFDAQRVDPREVLIEPDVFDKVDVVGDGFVRCGSKTWRGKVLVAAGIWCEELLEGLPPMSGLYGASLLVPGKIEHPKIHVYAPYRQAVAFQLDKNLVWFGDGTALVQKTWMKRGAGSECIEATRHRAALLMKLDATFDKVKINVGIRPYVEGHKAGYFERVHKSTWVSTGGAKNGTVLAAWQAHRFVTEALK
jgi:glycine/D-amino acid oxidase-like deaminating enzyme